MSHATYQHHIPPEAPELAQQRHHYHTIIIIIITNIRCLCVWRSKLEEQNQHQADVLGKSTFNGKFTFCQKLQQRASEGASRAAEERMRTNFATKPKSPMLRDNRSVSIEGIRSGAVRSEKQKQSYLFRYAPLALLQLLSAHE